VNVIGIYLSRTNSIVVNFFEIIDHIMEFMEVVDVWSSRGTSAKVEDNENMELF
jgi:hypothetical protein